MNWTTEYPTKPGYYWIKNYILKAWDPMFDVPQGLVPDPVIVEIDSALRIEDLLGLMLDRENIVSAEWCGPIEPPQEPQYTGGPFVWKTM
jgi:hypothetical protein